MCAEFWSWLLLAMSVSNQIICFSEWNNRVEHNNKLTGFCLPWDNKWQRYLVGCFKMILSARFNEKWPNLVICTLNKQLLNIQLFNQCFKDKVNSDEALISSFHLCFIMLFTFMSLSVCCVMSSGEKKIVGSTRGEWDSVLWYDVHIKNKIM